LSGLTVLTGSNQAGVTSRVAFSVVTSLGMTIGEVVAMLSVGFGKTSGSGVFSMSK